MVEAPTARRRNRVLLGVGVLVVVALVTVLVVRAGQPARTTVWADEFDGAAGSPPDPDRWTAVTGGTGWGNEELQRYTASTDNAALDGAGHLAITLRQDTSGADCWYGPCRYTSARLTTLGHTEVRYGRLEARMRLATGAGVWPAFWTTGADIDEVGWPASGEIDVMEHIGSAPGTVHGALHGPGYDTLSDVDLPGNASVDEAFHTYAVEWTEDSVAWLVDGRRYHVEHLDGRGAPGQAFGKPHCLLLNVAAGGRWPGPPDPGLSLPLTTLVDYVRVYALPG